MKEYFKKILNIVFVKDEAIEYIEKDSKKIAKNTYKILKNICILITALIFAYMLIYVRLEGIVNAFENNHDLEFSISKDGIEFDSGEKKEQNIGVIKQYAISNDLDIITINDRELNKDNEEQYKKIYDTDKNKLIITKEKVYTYENKILSKSLDIKEELNGENFLDVVIYKNDIINFYKSYNLKAYIFVLVFIVAFLTLLFIVLILSLFAKAIGFTVIAALNTFNVLNIDGKVSYNIYIYSLIPAYIIWNIFMVYSINLGIKKNIEDLNRKYLL